MKIEIEEAELKALVAVAENSRVQKEIIDQWLERDDESAMRLVSRLRGIWSSQDKALSNLAAVRKQ